MLHSRAVRSCSRRSRGASANDRRPNYADQRAGDRTYGGAVTVRGLCCVYAVAVTWLCCGCDRAVHQGDGERYHLGMHLTVCCPVRLHSDGACPSNMPCAPTNMPCAPTMWPVHSAHPAHPSHARAYVLSHAHAHAQEIARLLDAAATACHPAAGILDLDLILSNVQALLSSPPPPPPPPARRATCPFPRVLRACHPMFCPVHAFGQCRLQVLTLAPRRPRRSTVGRTVTL